MKHPYIITVLLLLTVLLCASCTGLHEKKLQSMQGMHISQAISALGQPTQSGGGYYMWQRQWQVERGGYHTTRYKTVKHYDKKGRFVGSTEIPYEHYIEPYTQHLACVTRLYVDSHGLITRYELEGNGCD